MANIHLVLSIVLNKEFNVARRNLSGGMILIWCYFDRIFFFNLSREKCLF